MIGRVILAALLMLGSLGRAEAAWPGHYADRLAALALIETLNAELLSHDSATLTLERWCAAHHLAEPARIVAHPDRGAEQHPTEEQRRLLNVSDTEPVKYRRVRLACGDHVLSEADNWYVPARLTPAMNQALETTDTPFGKAVADLHFRRRTLTATLLWSPLPDGWETAGTRPPDEPTLAIPAQVLQHKAILVTEAGVPFSDVVETYTGEVLGFPAP